MYKTDMEGFLKRMSIFTRDAPQTAQNRYGTFLNAISENVRTILFFLAHCPKPK